MTLRLTVGLAMTSVAFWFAGHRLLMLSRLGKVDVSEVLLRSVRRNGTDTSAPTTSRATARHPEGNLP